MCAGAVLCYAVLCCIERSAKAMAGFVSLDVVRSLALSMSLVGIHERLSCQGLWWMSAAAA